MKALKNMMSKLLKLLSYCFIPKYWNSYSKKISIIIELFYFIFIIPLCWFLISYPSLTTLLELYIAGIFGAILGVIIVNYRDKNDRSKNYQYR